MSETPDHYNMQIQPIEFIVKNNIPFREANIIKYVCRHRDKGGIDDLHKAQHYLQMLIDEWEAENEVKYETSTWAEELEKIEKRKAEIIAKNKEWEAIVKANDSRLGALMQDKEPVKYRPWNGPRRESIKTDDEIEQLENLKAEKIAANKDWASIVDRDAKEDKTQYEPLQDPNYMQGFNYCEECKTHHLANRDGW
jgi:hypothetical protein